MTHREFFAFTYSLMADQAGSVSEFEKWLAKVTGVTEQVSMEARAANNSKWADSTEGRNQQLGLMSMVGGAAAKRR